MSLLNRIIFPFLAATAAIANPIGGPNDSDKSLASGDPLAVLCDQYGYFQRDNWAFNNNLWGSGSANGGQCTTVSTVASGGVTWSTSWHWKGDLNTVKSYANVGKYLAKKPKMSDIKSLPTHVVWDYAPRDGPDAPRANVAYDLFTAANPGHVTDHGDYELMVWQAQIGGVLPIGSRIVSSVWIEGNEWQLYFGTNVENGMKVYSFIPAGWNWKLTFKADLMKFFQYLSKEHKYPLEKQHLLVFQQGTEPFTGKGVYTVKEYSASMNF